MTYEPSRTINRNFLTRWISARFLKISMSCSQSLCSGQNKRCSSLDLYSGWSGIESRPGHRPFGWDQRGRIGIWGSMSQAGRSRFRFPMRSLDFSFKLFLPTALWPWGRLSLWQKWVPGIFLGLKGGRRLKLTTSQLRRHLWDDYLEKIWEPRRLTSLWASTVRYRDSFTFLFVVYCNHSGHIPG
jgi:hypothetical protein